MTRRTRRLAALAVTLAAVASCTGTALAAPADLDPSFGRDNVATIDLGADEFPKALAVAPDGKVVVSGLSSFRDPTIPTVSRLDPNGALDRSFDGDGSVRFANAFATFSNGVVQPDGRIVITHARSGVAVIARLKSDGSPDTTFDGDGEVTISSAGITRLALQPDGKIIAAGFAGNNPIVHRFDAEGKPDPTFDTDGRVEIVVTDGTQEIPSAVALQPDGRIVLLVASVNSPRPDVVYRLDDAGGMDRTFDADGRRVIGRDGADSAHALALQPDGKIVLAGTTRLGSEIDATAFRLNADGTPDASFDGDGIVSLSLDTAANEQLVAVALQRDGKIVLAGGTFGPAGDRGIVYQLGSDGARDTGFDGDGKLFIDAGGLQQARAMALQADGKIVLAGEGPTDPVGNRNTLVLRLLGDSEVAAPPPMDVPPAAAPPSPASAPPAADRLAPRVTGLALAPRRFRAARGTRLRFTLSEPATVRVAVEKERPGRRVGRRCTAPTRRLANRRRCTRLRSVRAFTRDGLRAGAVTVPLATRGFAPGRYRVTLTATDPAGNRSTPTRATFAIAARSAR